MGELARAPQSCFSSCSGCFQSPCVTLGWQQIIDSGELYNAVAGVSIGMFSAKEQMESGLVRWMAILHDFNDGTYEITVFDSLMEKVPDTALKSQV